MKEYKVNYIKIIIFTLVIIYVICWDIYINIVNNFLKQNKNQ